MAEKNNPETLSQRPKLDIEDIKRRLDMMDQRLDNIDSIVSAVVERVMNQPIVINITCPYCGKNVEVSVIGSQKPGKQ
ncbi:MAG TPA: hypothetical protein G4N90_03725 [Dehalococcoidia bacterium]|nr:hypothetical protein [Dehalococcoidia bacterium]